VFTALYVLYSTFCPHSVFMFFEWIWAQTAIISLYSIDWLVFITETECLLRGTFYILRSAQTVYLWVLCGSEYKEWFFTVQHWLVGFYNWGGVCLLRGAFYVLRSAHTVYLCVLCGSENKQRIFHCRTLIDWLILITEMECVYCAVRSTFYVLPTQFICVFCVDLRTNSNYFIVQHWLTGWFL